MAVSKLIVTILLILIGIVIALVLISYFYGGGIELWKHGENITKPLDLAQKLLVLSIAFRRSLKRSSISSFLVALIVAIVVVIIIAFIYYYGYQSSVKSDILNISKNVTNKSFYIWDLFHQY